METDSQRERAKAAEKRRLTVEAQNLKIKKRVKALLKTVYSERTEEDVRFLKDHSHLVEELAVRKVRNKKAADKLVEFEDEYSVLEEKCNLLADAIKNANHAVVYTGAGISTAASVPDYRGPNGVWTKLSQGVASTYQDLSTAEPTLTHMGLVQLLKENHIKHIVSQNCDGLHVRSGIPPEALSEVHGNMFAEVCLSCSPQRLYWRCFDVTEATRLRRHRTSRTCHVCGESLNDTIVHFGEKRALVWPQNWQAAIDDALKTDLIICLGSSLKVLKGYRSLWCMTRKEESRPKLFIVNLQWTPKDKSATLKINGKCDMVMAMVTKRLGISIPSYSRENDPLLRMCSPLMKNELTTFTTSPINTAMVKLPVTCKTESEVTADELKPSVNQLPTARPGWFGKGLKKKTRRPSKSKRK